MAQFFPVTNDATILGILAAMLGLIFLTSSSNNSSLVKFYRVVPVVLVCYFFPSLLNSFDLVDVENSKIYYVTSRYLLPACLVLFILSVDFKGIIKLGYKAVIMFLVGTLGVVIGGPVSLLIVSSIIPELLDVSGPEAVWRGMTTIAGSWIGGGVNQAAMKEVYGAGDQIFSAMVAVDVIVANIWMAVLLVMATKADSIDSKSGADTSAILSLRKKVERFHKEKSRSPGFPDFIFILAVSFGVSGLAHFIADWLGPYFSEYHPNLSRYNLHSKFFWLIVISTAAGIILSFTRARNLERVGASTIGSVLLYFLIASIGMKMDLSAIFEKPQYFLIGLIWMIFHAVLMLFVAKLIKAPLFYMAVGSQANVGGAASAPIVASAFHPSLAPVGVLLAILGYAVGTYMAWLCGQILMVIG